MYQTIIIENIGFIVNSKVTPEGQILYQVRKPTQHGDEVKNEHLPYIPIEYPPGQNGATTTHGALDIGQQVVVKQRQGQEGTGFGAIVGVYQPKISSDKNLPGNFTLMDLIKKLEQITRNINIPPNLVQSVVNGVRVIKLQEKEKHKLALFYGLPTSGSRLGGAVIPQQQSIPTALASIASILSPSILSALPGINFSIGNLMSLLPDNLKDELFKALPPDVAEAFTSVMTLQQGYQSTSSMKVNLPVFLINVVNRLKTSTDVNEIFNAIDDIMSGDSDMTGMNLFPPTTQLAAGPFGPIPISIDSNGVVTQNISEELTKVLNQFTSLLGGIPTAGGGSLFDQIPELANVMKRVTPQMSGFMKQSPSLLSVVLSKAFGFLG